MGKYVVCPNHRVGRWTISDKWEVTPKGEKKWLCRCDCGTERFVLERALKNGGSLSCGCLRKAAAKAAVAHRLTGQTFGDLTVIAQAEKGEHKSGVWWLCRCACGNICQVRGTLLVGGKKTHCGCKSVKKQPTADITDKKFGRLTALYPTNLRDGKGYVVWHCRCDCGNETNVSYNELMYSTLQSCGCLRKELDAGLKEHLTHVGGTSLEMISSKKLPVNNTTGAKGVYFIKGKYVAKLVFCKKAYYLGKYENIDDAINARKSAEEAVFGKAQAFYALWQKRAEQEGEWAKANPMGFNVVRDGENGLKLECFPDLE